MIKDEELGEKQAETQAMLARAETQVMLARLAEDWRIATSDMNVANGDSPSFGLPMTKAEELGRTQTDKQAMLARLAQDWQNAISDMSLGDVEPQVHPDVQRVNLFHQSNDRPDLRPEEVSESQSRARAVTNGDSPSFRGKMTEEDELGRKQAEKQAVLAKFAEDWEQAMSGMTLGDGQPQMQPVVQIASLCHISDDADRRPGETAQPEDCAGARSKEVSPSSDVESCAAGRAMPCTTPKQEKSQFVTLKDAWSRFNLQDKEEIVFENQVSCSRADVRACPAARPFC
jgi:hypothetical protein